jgi:hypothetical protein
MTKAVPSTQLHVVMQTRSGFAREDPSTDVAIGVYTQFVVAQQVASLAGMARVISLVLDAVPPGVVQQAQALGFTLAK